MNPFRIGIERGISLQIPGRISAEVPTTDGGKNSDSLELFLKGFLVVFIKELLKKSLDSSMSTQIRLEIFLEAFLELASSSERNSEGCLKFLEVFTKKSLQVCSKKCMD